MRDRRGGDGGRNQGRRDDEGRKGIRENEGEGGNERGEERK